MGCTRRLAIVLTLAAVVLTPTAALAQRDPFEPAIDVGAVTTGTEEPAAGAETQPQSEPADARVLADTGADLSPWLASAYALIALGAGVLMAVRLRRAPAR